MPRGPEQPLRGARAGGRRLVRLRRARLSRRTGALGARRGRCVANHLSRAVTDLPVWEHSLPGPVQGPGPPALATGVDQADWCRALPATRAAGPSSLRRRACVGNAARSATAAARNRRKRGRSESRCDGRRAKIGISARRALMRT